MESVRNKGGGRNSCVACGHPDRQALNQALAALVPLSRLSKKYGISISSLSRHRSQHLVQAEFANLKRARAGISKASPQSALQRIEDGLEALEELMANTAKAKESTQWLTAYRERVRTLELIGKAKGEFSDAPVVTVNVWQSEDWGRIRATIFEVLAQLPAVRAELAKRLLALGEDTANGHADAQQRRPPPSR